MAEKKGRPINVRRALNKSQSTDSGTALRRIPRHLSSTSDDDNGDFRTSIGSPIPCEGQVFYPEEEELFPGIKVEKCEEQRRGSANANDAKRTPSKELAASSETGSPNVIRDRNGRLSNSSESNLLTPCTPPIVATSEGKQYVIYDRSSSASPQ